MSCEGNVMWWDGGRDESHPSVETANPACSTPSPLFLTADCANL